MKAAYYESFGGAITLEQLPDPHPVPGGVVIAVKASGLCLSDWHGWKGHDKDIRLPHVPGHELAGEIVATGAGVKRWNKGDRVTVPFVSGCGHCPTCLQGDPQVCPDQFQPGFTHWGSFAEYVSIHYADNNLVALPPGMSFATAASLGCRFATSFRAIHQIAKVKAGESIAIFGCGGVGLSAINIAHNSGAHVIAIDRKEAALEYAGTLGADVLINSSEPLGLLEKIKTASHGGAHVTVDAIGHPDIIRQAFASLRRKGRHLQIGLLNPDEVNVSVPIDKIIAYELSVHGSHGMAASTYNQMLQMISTGRLQPQLLIDEEISLEEAIKILPVMNGMTGSGIKVITSF